MWLSAIKLALNAGTHIYKKRKETQMLMADAQATHASRMARGELEYKQAVMTNNQQGWKDEFVLILVSAPVMLLIWSIFSEDPEIINKLDMFFEQINNFPLWLQGLIIGGYSTVLGIKGVNTFKKK